MTEQTVILIIIIGGIASLAAIVAVSISLAKRPPKPKPRPIVSDIGALLGVVAEYKAQDYDFGVRVVGDSMIEDGILPGDIALIRQQPQVEMGEIAAIVIKTRTGSEGVLKRYNIAYEERPDLAHWLLTSSNPSSEQIVVIPIGADVTAIRALYDEAVRSGKMGIRYFEDAELVIAGKYVGVLRQGQSQSQSQAALPSEGRTR